MEPSATADGSSLQSNGRDTSDQAIAFAGLAVNESRDVLSFYKVEAQILALYDHLNDLKLEIALLEARDSLPSLDDFSLDGDPTTELRTAEKECLEARAAYILRKSIVENVLITDPILKAVHAGVNATPAERSLHPLIDRRDILSIAHTNMSTELSSTSKASTLIAAESIRTQAQNRGKAATLLDLARKTEIERTNAIQESNFSDQVDRLRADTKTARTRWRIMKNVVAAVIVGSGVDWAADDGLRDIVLDEEDEGD